MIQTCVLLLLAGLAGFFLSSNSELMGRQAAFSAFGFSFGKATAPDGSFDQGGRPAPAVLQNWRRFEGASFARLIFGLSAEPRFRTDSAADGLTITFENARVAPRFEPRQPAGTGLVQEIVAAETQGAVELRLRFRPGSRFAAFTLPAPARLVVDVWDGASPDGELEADLNRILTPPGGYGPVRRVIIDPGHGGRDLGAVGPGGYTEKQLTLEVAHRLKRQLEARGFEVLLTRDGDYFLPLGARSDAANGSAADLFVSIHANGDTAAGFEFGESPLEAHGVETYFLSHAISAADERLAERENAAGGDPSPAVELADEAKSVESRLLATHVHRSLVAGLRRVNAAAARDRGVRQAPFFVLSNTRIPSVLVEVSFITNRADEQRLQTSAFQQKIADSLADGIRLYLADRARRGAAPEQLARR